MDILLTQENGLSITAHQIKKKKRHLNKLILYFFQMISCSVKVRHCFIICSLFWEVLFIFPAEEVDQVGLDFSGLFCSSRPQKVVQEWHMPPIKVNYQTHNFSCKLVWTRELNLLSYTRYFDIRKLSEYVFMLVHI